METIPRADCSKIGFIRKTHGVHGELIVEFESPYEMTADEPTRFFLEREGLLVPFFVAENGFRAKSGKTAFVLFDGVNTEKQARRLVGSNLYLFTTEIINEPEEPKDHQFLNYTLFDEKTGKIGIISEVNDFSGNTVMTVKQHGAEVLIPFHEELLVAVDQKQETLTLRLPEGLF
jgi:16S rRNA processing protein RimM